MNKDSKITLTPRENEPRTFPEHNPGEVFTSRDGKFGGFYIVTCFSGSSEAGVSVVWILDGEQGLNAVVVKKAKDDLVRFKGTITLEVD